MNKTDKVIVNVIDETDIEVTPSTEEKAPVVDQFSIEALAFWREYLRQPKGRRAKTYRSRTSRE